MGFIQNLIYEQKLKTQKLKNELDKEEAKSKLISSQSAMVNSFTNSGYSHGGADTSKSWGKYLFESNSAKSDIEVNRKILRERSRDLAMNAPIATASINATRSSVIGAGLIPNPKINFKFLGISEEEADNLKAQIKTEWKLWSESTLCDAADLNNFCELQQIAFLDWLKNGESFALIKYDKPSLCMPYRLRIKLIEADRVSSPNEYNGDYNGFDTHLKNGNRISNGVEINSDGKVVAYHISSAFPGEADNIKWEWTRVAKRGDRTGNPNILHIFNAERAEQYRGVPFLAPVILAIKQLTRYTEAEIMAAVINAMLSLFITTEGAEEIEFGGNDVDEASRDEEVSLGNGNIVYLKPGESIQAVESKHPSGSFDTFLKAMALQIGSALDLAPEVLLKQFSSNFSASKGALNETWKSFNMRRKWFINDFCQPIYELFLSEAVSSGRIKAPGYFTNPLIKNAYANATWRGPSQGCLNPEQEVSAAILKINSGLSTHEDECVAINGSDFDDNVMTLKSEFDKLSNINFLINEQNEKGGQEENEDS